MLFRSVSCAYVGLSQALGRHVAGEILALRSTDPVAVAVAAEAVDAIA